MNTPTPDRSSLHALLARARDLAVWVIGDIMLDEYAVGSVGRISPEAPVPVLRVASLEGRLGGAANVARQVAVLGAHVSLAGLVGHDAAGEQILKLCAASGIDTRAVQQLAGRQTSRKLRALARNQQLVRLDWEDATPCPGAAVDAMLERLRAGRAPDVIILSDYAKGLLTDEFLNTVAEAAASVGTRVVVDPKRRDLGAYPRGSIMTPNLRELELAAGTPFDPEDTASIAAAAQALVAQAGATALVVKRGERGMLVASAGEPCLPIPARGRTLFDATGAGDTVVAVLATALATGAPLGDAARIANAAAGIVVGKIGTVSAEPAEIIEFMNGGSTHKVLDREALAAQVHEWRAAGKRIVVTNGCFDLLHAGHLSLLHQAAQYGDVLVLAVNSDASVQRLKGPGRPLIPEHERAAMLASLACVDAVTLFDEDTPLSLLQAIRPDVLVKGQDYKVEQVVGRDLVESNGGSVVLVPLVPDKSTTALIDRIMNRDPAS